VTASASKKGLQLLSIAKGQACISRRRRSRSTPFDPQRAKARAVDRPDAPRLPAAAADRCRGCGALTTDHSHFHPLPLERDDDREDRVDWEMHVLHRLAGREAWLMSSHHDDLNVAFNINEILR
jgi:hypothetical protein